MLDGSGWYGLFFLVGMAVGFLVFYELIVSANWLDQQIQQQHNSTIPPRVQVNNRQLRALHEFFSQSLPLKFPKSNGSCRAIR